MTPRRFAVVLMASLVLPATIGWAQSEPSNSEGSTTASKALRIPITSGGVKSSELFHGVSQDLHWVAGSITAFSRAFTPSQPSTGTLVEDVTGIRVEPRISLETLQQLASRFPDAFQLEVDESGEATALLVDNESLSRQLANRKSRLRSFLAGAQGKQLATLTKVGATWNEAQATPRRIVVVMAGLHGVDSTATDVAEALHDRTNLPMCVFAYPNDGPVLESAALLNEKLAVLRREYPSSPITLLTHSMGGLVSRAALELPLGNTNSRSDVTTRTGVDQLIQICPPNHGSALAEYGPLLEGAEQAYRLVGRRSGKSERILFQAIVDGFNEASRDLQPDSKLLSELNQSARNPNVRYTILAGNDGPLRAPLMNLVGNIWASVAQSIDEPAEVNRRVTDILRCSELQKGKGDGVVSLQSARLDGVEDFETFAMHHLVWNELDSKAGQQLLNEITDRLGISL
ncbi:MAG: esterase/lipase family protein [Aureliella sp.]